MSILKLPINFVTVLITDIKKHIIKTNEIIDTVNLLEKNLIRTNLSAYEVAVKNGFIGTEKDWLNSLKPENVDLTFVAGEPLGSPRVIMVNNNLAYLYDLAEINIDKVLGISTNSVIAGHIVNVKANTKIITSGLITNNAYYAGALGIITNILPISGVCLEIGYAVSTTELIVDIKQPIILI